VWVARELPSTRISKSKPPPSFGNQLWSNLIRHERTYVVVNLWQLDRYRSASADPRRQIADSQRYPLAEGLGSSGAIGYLSAGNSATCRVSEDSESPLLYGKARRRTIENYYFNWRQTTERAQVRRRQHLKQLRIPPPTGHFTPSEGHTAKRPVSVPVPGNPRDPRNVVILWAVPMSRQLMSLIPTSI